MAYVCLECGRNFEEPAAWKEYFGECFGTPAYDTVTGCPYCHGDYMDEDEYEKEYGEEDEDEDESEED